MTNAIQTEWININTPDGAMPGYLCRPPAGQGPGLLLLQEIFGVNEHIRAVAEQYALAGFVVLAPDVFWRQAPRVELGYVGDDRQQAFGLMQALQPAQTVADLQASVATLRGVAGVGPKVGAIGYCMGGRLAYTAAALAGVDAAVAYYGGGIHSQLQWAEQITCPVQFHFAGHDEHIPPEAVAAVQQAFVGKPAQVFSYPGSMHGFNCWARASYHAPSAALALGRSLLFLARELFPPAA